MCIDLSFVENAELNMRNQENVVSLDETVDLDDYDESPSSLEKLETQVLAGGSLVAFPPRFTPDGKSIFVICNNVVRSFDVGTGEWEFDMTSSDGPFIGMQFSINQSALVVCCTASGAVYQFRWKSGGPNKTVKLSLEGSVDAFSLIHYRNTCLVSHRDDRNATRIDLFDYTTGEFMFTFKKDIKTSSPVLFAVPPGHHRYFAAAIDSKLVVFGDQHSRYSRELRNMHDQAITVATPHPTEDCIATGDASGKVILWRQFMQNETLVKEVYHWHANPVQAVAFSESGSFFYSGGLENVLVKWTLNDPDSRQFLPRMSASIAQIAVGVENSKVTVTTSDNAIYIHDAQLRLLRTVQYFTYTTPDKSGQDIFPVGLRIDPRTQSLVMNGRVGHLQFFSTQSNSLLFNLDIVMQNTLSPEAAKVLYNTRVTHCTLNQDWMATAESWDDHENTPETRLKFWIFNEVQQSYMLNTNVESPHSKPVTALEFSSKFSISRLVCASAGHDRCIKLWALETSQSIYRQGRVWMCIGVLSYKNMPVKSLAFSRDSSLLIAGFGYVLCCWDSRTQKLKCLLSPPSGLDGNIAKVTVTLPKNSGSKAEAKQEEFLRQVQQYLDGDDSSLVKTIASLPSNPLRAPKNLTSEHQRSVFAVIKRTNLLNTYQKIKTLVTLEVPFRASEASRQELARFFEDRQKRLAEARLHLPSRISSLKSQVRYRKHLKYQRIDGKKYPNWFKAFVKGIKDTPQKSKQQKKEQSGNLTVPVQIKQVIFGSEEHSHLVLAVTDEKIMVWNLLSLRLVHSSFMAVRHIFIDEYTNLLAAFTVTNELHIFHISSAFRYYVHSNVPEIHGATWIPRRFPRQTSLIVDWQAHSELIFLTKQQQIAKLSSHGRDIVALPHLRPSVNGSDQFRTPMARLLAENSVNQTVAPVTNYTVGLSKKASIAEIILLQPHTAPPMRTLCKNLITSMVNPRKAVPVAESTQKSPVDNLNGFWTDEDDSESEEVVAERTKQLKVIGELEDGRKTEERGPTRDLSVLFKKVSLDDFSL